MISQVLFKEYLGQIGPKFKNVNINWDRWFEQFNYYEEHWNNYFKDFLVRYKKAQPVQFVFWESCPGGMPFPHQNYAFDANRFANPIHGNFDTYLKRECQYFGVSWNPNGVNRVIGELICELSEKGVLIIDLYPTHGVSLDKTNREKLFANLFSTYSKDKLTQIGNSTSSLKKNASIKVTGELSGAGINNSMSINLKKDVQTALKLNTDPIFL
jgi:hypothetical protein